MGRKTKIETYHIDILGFTERLSEKADRMKELAQEFLLLCHIDHESYKNVLGQENNVYAYNLLKQFIENREKSAKVHRNFLLDMKKLYSRVTEGGFYNIYHNFTTLFIWFMESEYDDFQMKIRPIVDGKTSESIYRSIHDDINRINLEFYKWSKEKAEKSKDGKVAVLDFNPNEFNEGSLFKGIKPMIFNDFFLQKTFEFYGLDRLIVDLKKWGKEKISIAI